MANGGGTAALNSFRKDFAAVLEALKQTACHIPLASKWANGATNGNTGSSAVAAQPQPVKIC
eukprot:10979476-Alexandrium_andersonii.AAC.1